MNYNQIVIDGLDIVNALEEERPISKDVGKEYMILAPMLVFFWKVSFLMLILFFYLERYYSEMTSWLKMLKTKFCFLLRRREHR